MHLFSSKFHSLPLSGSIVKGFYPGVLIIEKGPAKGHYAIEDGTRTVEMDYSNPEHAELDKFPINIGDAALDDVVRCGNDSPDGVKCKLDHGSTVKDIVGNYSNFRRDGDKVRADLTLLNSSSHRPYVEELISTMANKIGNSIDFTPSYEIQGDVAVARCLGLSSVDIVDSPAATNSLFNEQTNPQTIPRMALTKEEVAEIGGMLKIEISAQLSTVKAEFKTQLDDIKTKMDDGGDDDDDEEAKKKKAELEAKKDDDAAKGEMSALIEKATLSAVQKIFPKSTVESLTSLAAQSHGGKDEYAEKVTLALQAGIPERGMTQFMARHHPKLYNAKFGAAKATA